MFTRPRLNNILHVSFELSLRQSEIQTADSRVFKFKSVYSTIELTHFFKVFIKCCYPIVELFTHLFNVCQIHILCVVQPKKVFDAKNLMFRFFPLSQCLMWSVNPFQMFNSTKMLMICKLKSNFHIQKRTQHLCKCNRNFRNILFSGQKK